MNILLLTDDMNLGGVPRHVVDLANGLYDRRVGVAVASTDGPGRERLNPDIPFVSLNIVRPGALEKNYTALPGAFVRLKEYVTGHRVDIVHTHKRFSDMLGRMVARTSGIVHLSTCHNSFTNLRLVSWFGDVTIACSEFVHDSLLHTYGKKPDRLATIYYGIEPLHKHTSTKNSTTRKRFAIRPKERLVLSVGHLSPAKDRTTLIEAVAIVQAELRTRKARLLIVGEGVEGRQISEQIRRGRLEDLVTLLPGASDVEELMNTVEFCVLSSVQEGLPFVLLEAASLSKPHIATSVGGIAEFVADGKTGLLVPPREPGKLAASIVRLLDEPRLTRRLGKNANAQFLRAHQYDRFVDETIRVYKKAEQLR